MALDAINFDTLILEKFLRVTGTDITTGEVQFMFDNIKDGNIEGTEDTEYITGANGVNLVALARNKTCTVTFNRAFLSFSTLSAQTGSPVSVASAQNKFKVPKVEIIKATSATAASVSGTPIAGTLKYVYTLNGDGSLKDKFTLTTDSVTAGKFALSGSDLTFAADALTSGQQILAVYDEEVTVGKKISNRADTKAIYSYLIADLVCLDRCNNNTKYITRFIMPNAKVSGNFTIDVGNTDTAHAFSAEAMPAGCGVDPAYFDWYIVED